MKRSSDFDVLKFFAIISIICAHLSPITSTHFLDKKISILLNSIGCLGVGLFFILAGYFFYKNNDKFTDFCKKKLSTILLPWLLVGSLVYLVVYYFNNNLSIIGYLQFILGYGSYLYYLMVLILLYLLYFKLKQNDKFLYLTTVLSIISITSTIMVGYDKFSYINIFNWMLYFNIGIILNKYKLYDKFKKLCRYTYPINFLTLFLIFNFHLYFDTPIGYWTTFGTLTILLNVLLLFGYIENCDFSKNKVINYIGKNSLAFYLIHMPIAGVIVRITNHYSNTILILLRPVVVLLLTLLIIYIYDIIVKKIGIKYLKNFVGIR